MAIEIIDEQYNVIIDPDEYFTDIETKYKKLVKKHFEMNYKLIETEAKFNKLLLKHEQDGLKSIDDISNYCLRKKKLSCALMNIQRITRVPGPRDGFGGIRIKMKNIIEKFKCDEEMYDLMDSMVELLVKIQTIATDALEKERKNDYLHRAKE